MMASLIDLLPDNLYVKMTNYLPVNDIEKCGESGVDVRTGIAMANLKHAVIYDENLFDGKSVFDINSMVSKLPKSLKTIKLYGKKLALSVEQLAKQFPKLEKLPAGFNLNSLYVNNIGMEYSNLKYIKLSRGIHEGLLPQFRQLTKACPKLEELSFDLSLPADQFVGLFANCKNLKRLTIDDDLTLEQMKCLVQSLPLSLEVLTCENGIADQPLKYCFEQKRFKTELYTVEPLHLPLTEFRLNSIVSLNVCDETSMQFIHDMPNLRELTLCPLDGNQILEPFCEPQFLSKLISIHLCIWYEYEEIYTNDLCKKFLEVRGHQLKTCDLVSDGAALLVGLLASAKNLRLDSCKIKFKNNSELAMTVDNLSPLYGIQVHDYMTLEAVNVEHITSLRNMALKTVADRKCRIRCLKDREMDAVKALAPEDYMHLVFPFNQLL